VQPNKKKLNSLLNQIYYLLAKDFKVEWRNKYGIASLLLYVLSSIFIIYIGLIQLDPRIWNALYWILMLFAAISTIVKNPSQESQARALYEYTLYSPYAVILSRYIYHAVWLIILGMMTMFILSILTIQPIRNFGQFILLLCLASASLSTIFTFVGFLGQKTNNPSTIIAILGFPLTIPIFLTILKISAQSMGMLHDTSVINDWMILSSIWIILAAISIILFPYLWRE
jgi:heme exporter protein B